jgi:hypothetical protein
MTLRTTDGAKRLQVFFHRSSTCDTAVDCGLIDECHGMSPLKADAIWAN